MASLRVAAHVHSRWSYDGRWELVDLARAFRRQRDDAVLMAEHDRTFDAERWDEYRAACAAASTEALVLVPGIEYSDPDNVVHVPVWGADGFLGRGLPTDELLARCEAAGGSAVLAHPGRRAAWERLGEADWRRLLGIELWNRKYDGYAPGAAAQRALRRHEGLVPFAGLDFHTARQFHPLAMLVESDGRTPQAIQRALRARRVRASAFGMPSQLVTSRGMLPALVGAERARGALARRVRARKFARPQSVDRAG